MGSAVQADRITRRIDFLQLFLDSTTALLLVDTFELAEVVRVAAPFEPAKPHNQRTHAGQEGDQQERVPKRIGSNCERENGKSKEPAKVGDLHATGSAGSSGVSAGTADLSFATLASNAANGLPSKACSLPASIMESASHSAREKLTEPKMCSSNAS